MFRLFRTKETVSNEDTDDYVGTDATMLPNGFVHTKPITNSEALEEILNKLDAIEAKLDKL